jgi:hypothetical protein
MSGNPFLDDLHDDILHPGLLDKRYDELQARHDLPGADTCTTCDQDEHEAIEEIQRFRDDVKSTVGDDRAWTDSSGMISETYFVEYIHEDVKGMYGHAVIDALDFYLNWDAIEDDYADKFEMIEFDGVNYFADREGNW